MQSKINFTYTGIIISINFLVFLILLVLGFDPYNCGLNICKDVALSPVLVLAGENLWTFITSMFSHFGLGHLAMNMISLMFIGGLVERLIGKKRFLWFYLVAGLFAGVLYVLLAGIFGTSEIGARLFGSPTTFAVGASGAIFGLGGLLAVLVPRMRVLVFFIIPMSMWAAMTFFIVVLWVVSFGTGLPIGNSAHFGGLIVGIIYGFYLKQKYPKKVEILRRRLI